MSNVIRIDALYFRRKRERTTAQLRAEVLDETITMAWLCEFVAEMGREQNFGEMMLRVEREFS